MPEEKGQGLSMLAGSIPVIGGLASTLISRLFNRGDWKRENQYNSPIEQIRRLREAGLSPGMMYQGAGGGQAGQISQTGIDPTLGTAQGMEKYFQNRMTKAELKQMDETTRKIGAEADEAQARAKWFTDNVPNFDGNINTNMARMMDAKLKKEQADASTAEAMQMIWQRKNHIEDYLGKKMYDKAVAEVMSILHNEKRLKYVLESEGRKRDMEKKIYDALKEGGLPSLDAVIYGYMYGGMRSPSINTSVGGTNLGI